MPLQRVEKASLVPPLASPRSLLRGLIHQAKHYLQGEPLIPSREHPIMPSLKYCLFLSMPQKPGLGTSQGLFSLYLKGKLGISKCMLGNAELTVGWGSTLFATTT